MIRVFVKKRNNMRIEKKIKQLGVLLLLFCNILFNQLKAQSPIYDLAVTTRSNITDTASHSADINLYIYFKLTNPDSVSDIYILLGRQKDSFDFKNEHLTISKTEGITTMQTSDNRQFQFWSKSTMYNIAMPLSVAEEVHWITIYSKDISGNISSKKYHKIH